MIKRQIDLDEESDRILSGLAQDYHGDLGGALADLLQAHQTVEAFVEECEEAHPKGALRTRFPRGALHHVGRGQAAQPFVTVLFGEGVSEVFAGLPRDLQRRAADSIELISAFPRMYPVRRRGLMRGYRYLVLGRFLLYYSVASTEIRIAAIIPAAMRRA